MGRIDVAYKKSQVNCTAPFVAQLPQEVRITHPFHPLYNKKFGLLGYRRSWKNEYVDLHDEKNLVIAIPIKWTDAAPRDPFIVVANNRSYFRPEDLVRLVNLIGGIKNGSRHCKANYAINVK